MSLYSRSQQMAPNGSGNFEIEVVIEKNADTIYSSSMLS